MVVTDVDGNRFLDFAAGIAVCSTGHAHPKVSAAISEQAERLIHIAATDFYEPRYLELMERLAAIAPFEEKARVFLTNSGTEAVEGAIKLARYHTASARDHRLRGRRSTAGRWGRSRSRTRRSSSAPASARCCRWSTTPRSRASAPGARGPAVTAPPSWRYLRSTIFGRLISPKDVAAIVVEPIQGEGGYFPAPRAFLRGLRELCDEHGIVLIADEIQSGMGRTGRLVGDRVLRRRAGRRHHRQGHRLRHADRCLHRSRVAVDLAGRAPTARRSPATRSARPRRSPRSTCIEAEGLANADAMGERLRAGAGVRRREDDAVVRDIRGPGLMLGVEFASHGEADAVQVAAFERGLLTLECGESSLRFSPPLIVDAESVDTAIRIFGESLSAAKRPERGPAETGG